MAHYTDWPEYPTDLLDVVDYPTQTDDVDYVEAWLINALVNEMIAVQKELGTVPKGAFADVKTRLDDILPHYNDRGDPNAWDWELVDLTTDGTWYDLDCSAIVPAGAKAIQLRLDIQDDASNQYFRLRKKGNSNPYNVSWNTTQIANIANSTHPIVACDENRIIQYDASNTTWTHILILIQGWWK